MKGVRYSGRDTAEKWRLEGEEKQTPVPPLGPSQL
jgi:hypothetical protein